MGFLIKYKKLLLVMGFVIVVFALGYTLYAVFFKPAPLPPTVTEPGATIPSGGLPIAGEGEGQIVPPATPSGLPAEEGMPEIASQIAGGGLTQTNKLNDVTGLGVALSSDGSNLQFYNKEDGKFYKIDKNGGTTELTDKVFHSVENITWSENKNKAILEYPDGANVVYDFSTDKQTTLPAHWKDFDFSTGNQVVMKSIGLDPNNRWLAIVNDDGSEAKRIEAIGNKDATVYPSWSPNNQTIAMYTKGVDFDRQEVFFVGLNNENFKSTIVEGRGFQPKWQPSGDQLLYSVYSSATNLKPSLWIVNANGDNIGTGRKNLNLETWANKCVFADNFNLYCAVPESLEEGAGLFPDLAKNTKDNLYEINTQTGIKKLIAVPDGSYNISNPIIADDGRYFYFTDEITGKLYKIQLK